jgi:hypothetical protein
MQNEVEDNRSVTELVADHRSQVNDAVRNKKKKSEPMPTLISDLESAQEIAIKLISKYHEHLSTANILFACTNKSYKSGGRTIPGKVKKTTPHDKWLSASKVRDGDADFVVTISLEVWNPMSPNQRIALVDHLLTRLWGEPEEDSGKMKWSIRSPAVQEFPEVVERNGSWTDELGEMSDCLKASEKS